MTIVRLRRLAARMRSCSACGRGYPAPEGIPVFVPRDDRAAAAPPGTALDDLWQRMQNATTDAALSLVAVTDGLNRLFSNDSVPLRLARDLGLAAIDRLPAVKRLFMRHAMGTAGDLPRLARGEAL